MPLEIRELIIKATVSNKNSSLASQGGTPGKIGEAGINEIVDKVFEIIKEKLER